MASSSIMFPVTPLAEGNRVASGIAPGILFRRFRRWPAQESVHDRMGERAHTLSCELEKEAAVLEIDATPLKAAKSSRNYGRKRRENGWKAE